VPPLSPLSVLHARIFLVRGRHALSFHQYGPWLASPVCGVDRGVLLWGVMPPRQARGQPLHPICAPALGVSDAARVRHQRAGVPAVWRAPMLDRHRRGSRRDSRDPRCPRNLPRAGGSSSALGRVADTSSAARSAPECHPEPRTRLVHARLEPSCLPVNQLLTPLGIILTGFCPRCIWGGGRESPSDAGRRATENYANTPGGT
jgi:hypothetical protein